MKRGGWGRGGTPEVLDDLFYLFRRLLVNRIQVFLFRRDPGAKDHLYCVAYIIEDEKAFSEEKDCVVHLRGRRRVSGQFFLEVADHVVSKVSDRPAEEPWKAGHGHREVRLHQGLETGQRVPVMTHPFRPSVFPDFHLPGLHSENDPGIGAEEGVSAPFLSPFHALQKKDVGPPADFHQSRDRRFLIREDFPVHGYEVSPLGKGFEIFVRRAVHISS